jgi:hypothetical protein
MIEKHLYDFSLIIICNDDHIPMYLSDKLCKESVNAQRRFDIFKIGKELGIKKVIRLNYDFNDIDLYRLTSQLQLYIMLQGIQIVYCSNFIINGLKTTIDKICKQTGKQIYFPETKINLPDKIIDLMVGQYDY